jgi:hypothetical protein
MLSNIQEEVFVKMPQTNIVRDIVIKLLSRLRDNDIIEKDVKIFNVRSNYKEGEGVLQKDLKISDSIEMFSELIKKSGFHVVEMKPKLIDDDTFLCSVFIDIGTGEILVTIEIGIHPQHPDILNVAVSLAEDEEPTVVTGEW